MAHVQRTCGIGRDKLHQHIFIALSLFAKARCGVQHFFDHRLLGAGLEFEIQKARACNVDAFHPLAKSGCGHERGAQGFSHLSGVLAQRLGQMHGRRAG
jgi:hypothetical protein